MSISSLASLSSSPFFFASAAAAAASSAAFFLAASFARRCSCCAMRRDSSRENLASSAFFISSCSLWHAVGRAVGRVVSVLSIIRHHVAPRHARWCWWHGVAVAAAARLARTTRAPGAPRAVKVPTVAGRARRRRRRGKGVAAGGEGVLMVVGVGASKGHHLVASHGSTHGVVARVGHHTGGISTGRGLVRDVSPLWAGVVLGLAPSRWECGVVVGLVQTVRVDGLGPPSMAGSSLQGCTAARAVSRAILRRRVVDRDLARLLAARALGTRGPRSGGGRWWSGDGVMLDAGARGRVGRFDLVTCNVVPLVVLFGLCVVLALAARRNLDASKVFFLVGVAVVLGARRVVDGDVSPKRDSDVSVA
ncbi:hypothetical protein BS50DRAFT_49864 [Corynespora cassiicola Philippines]|uniref:Uncharacterized protein n=1 Tax=Corynespora cassiicola Philippines TaxID=1448308 RepID=A0A2T2NI39_CORCC|nr:hypothetical protein BS50DRAFT_49864 [Corynespora cassiicola Philippines]